MDGPDLGLRLVTADELAGLVLLKSVSGLSQLAG